MRLGIRAGRGMAALALIGLMSVSTAYASQSYELRFNWSGFKAVALPGEPEDQTVHYAPKGTHFHFEQRTDKKHQVSITWLPKDGKRSLNAPESLTVLGPQEMVSRTKVKKGLYEINQTDLPDNVYRLFSGIDYGAVTLPFKLQHDGTITAGATLGGYVGWRQRKLSFPTTLLASAGFAGIPTNDVNSGEIETKLGVTVATGLVVPIADAFQIGLILGMDHLGGEAGKTYSYENRGWWSFGIGYGFIK